MLIWNFNEMGHKADLQTFSANYPGLILVSLILQPKADLSLCLVDKLKK